MTERVLKLVANGMPGNTKGQKKQRVELIAEDSEFESWRANLPLGWVFKIWVEDPDEKDNLGMNQK